MRWIVATTTEIDAVLRHASGKFPNEVADILSFCGDGIHNVFSLVGTQQDAIDSLDAQLWDGVVDLSSEQEVDLTNIDAGFDSKACDPDKSDRYLALRFRGDDIEVYYIRK
jgi:hypothetical protein